MCGLTGILNAGQSQASYEPILKRMADAIGHRGPDDHGIWADSNAGIGLAHRRLSILDLSSQGHQPMFSASGRYVIVFNGEVYNFQLLRQELDSLWGNADSGSRARWRGHSDTEVILAAIEQWGIQDAVRKFTGMFAFALWDRKEHLLTLVRDRLGIKPLYYGWQGNSFLFGSELKAIREHPEFKWEINRNSLALLMRYSYIPAPHSIYQGIYKLLPGHILTLSAKNQNPVPDSHAYWSLEKVVEHGLINPFVGSEEEAIGQLDSVLRDAVKIRMIADVPLGAFLSGGIDSSTVVALMQAQSERPVKTFSIGFFEKGYNEAQHANNIAKHLGTDHTELYVTPEQAMRVIPHLATIYDEPFADASQIPTFLVSELAREKVTVSLSGDGGDELFCGYNRYDWGSLIWNKIKWLPKKSRKFFAKALSSVSPQNWDQLFYKLDFLLPSKLKIPTPGNQIHKIGGILDAEGPDSLYLRLVSHWNEPTSLVKGSIEPSTPLSQGLLSEQSLNFPQRMMFLDTITYLPDDILTKVDRASMGVSLEARVPLLDHRVVEFAWRVPMGMKIKNKQNKWLLRQVLYKYVPKKLIERPKMGFGVPIDFWLRGPLREWAEELLDEQRLRDEGFFHPAPIRIKWAEHLSGKRNWQYPLWNVLMFQAWLEKNRTPASKI